LSAAVQAWHKPVHAVSQHTLSTQPPAVEHSFDAKQPTPWPFFSVHAPLERSQ
jgi:hypothetical protein